MAKHYISRLSFSFNDLIEFGELYYTVPLVKLLTIVPTEDGVDFIVLLDDSNTIKSKDVRLHLFKEEEIFNSKRLEFYLYMNIEKEGYGIFYEISPSQPAS